MANPYKDGGGVGAKAKLKRMLGQKPGTNVGKFADAPASEDEIGRHLQGYDIRMPGGNEKSKTRLDRRARGGRTSKKKGHTTVNVLVGGGHGAPQPAPALPVPGVGGGSPVPPPRPPMPMPPQAMPGNPMPPMVGAPGMPPMPPGGMPPRPGMPPMMPPRARGGKVAGDWPPASTKHTPKDKPRRGQDNWKVKHTKPRGQKNPLTQKNKP